MANIILKNINKIYPNGFHAVYDFNLEIQDKEFIVFVGPSGCGKSTTLRMIAGLEDITTGDFLIDGERMNEAEPRDRGIAMVFQSYALYPHMTVEENMAFGLKIRKVKKEIIDRRVKEAAEMLGLEKYLNRKPRALSGGQRQRVALGRAIVQEAKVFLLDEPLSNLDAKLRVTMRGELIKLHRRIGTTSIYVTHDQIEAMTMASRIVVMKEGRIQQVGEPKEIYESPNNVFVGGFIGTPPMNFIKGVVNEDGMFTSDAYSVQVPAGKVHHLKEYGYIGKEVYLGIRPEDIHDDPIVLETYSNAKIHATVDLAELLGAETNIYMTINGANVIASVDARDDLKVGSEIDLAFDMNKAHFFDVETEKNIFKLDPSEKKE